MKRVNDHGLEELILNAEGHAVVVFLAAFSIPCEHFVPELRAAAEALRGRAEFALIDAVENPTVTDEYGVTAVPTTLVVRDGKELARYEGPYSREALVERITDIMAGKGKGKA